MAGWNNSGNGWNPIGTLVPFGENDVFEHYSCIDDSLHSNNAYALLAGHFRKTSKESMGFVSRYVHCFRVVAGIGRVEAIRRVESVVERMASIGVSWIYWNYRAWYFSA